MKKVLFSLFLLISILGYGQVSQVLTDDNGKVILTSDGTKLLTTEQDPNNFEYTPNPEWIPVNGVADGEIWILAFDGGSSNLFTITCTTSSGEWQMDIYGGADGKQLLRTYDTTSNLALSHTLITGTGKFSSTSGYYTYKIVIKPKTVGADILTIISATNNTPYLIANFGAKNLTDLHFGNCENMVYANTWYTTKIGGNMNTLFSFANNTNMTDFTMPETMDLVVRLGEFHYNNANGTFANDTKLKRLIFPKSMKELRYLGSTAYSIYAAYGVCYGCTSLVYVKLPNELPNLLNFGGYGDIVYSNIGAFYNCTSLKEIEGAYKMQNLSNYNSTISNNNLLTTISTATQLPLTSIYFKSTGLRALTTFNQPVLRCSSFTLTGTSNADRSSIAFIEIDWANSQFTGYIDIRYNNLSATELDRIFTALPTVVVSRTIYVASNAGSTTCNPTIATAKNWVVVTL